MNILQLLPHHRIVHDRLRMRALLPNLVTALRLVRRTAELELMEQPLAVLRFELIEQTLRRVALQIRQRAREVRRGQDRVEMAVEDDPPVDLEALVVAAIGQRVREQVATRRRVKTGIQATMEEVTKWALSGSWMR